MVQRGSVMHRVLGIMASYLVLNTFTVTMTPFEKQLAILENTLNVTKLR